MMDGQDAQALTFPTPDMHHTRQPHRQHGVSPFDSFGSEIEVSGL
jgi:hypothetical protein